MRRILILLPALLCCAASSPAADTPGAPEVFGTIGATKLYLDEPFQFPGGAGARIPVYDRLSLYPEVLLTSAPSFSNRFFLASAAYDLRKSDRSVVPYLIGGGGLMTEHNKRIPYSFHEATWLGGIGVRFAAGKRITLSPVFRIGSNSLPLVTLHVGFRLGSSRGLR